ncbi:hypothetical protein [Nostoc sp.]|uniref:hypothetical protein n=1 Tax=Nostoc sp. TaxID=1180 RepID=UPI002FFA9426
MKRFLNFCISVKNLWYLLILIYSMQSITESKRELEMVNSLTACQIRKTTNRFIIGTAAMAVACSSIALTPATADAVIRDYSCSAGGFRGTIRVDYNQGVGRNASSIIRVNYIINKGRNRGGNKANVSYSDGATLPIKKFYTGDAGI